MNYFQGPTALDYVRARLVHAPLCELDPGAADGVDYGVVESIDVSDDLSEYTLHVRDGVSFTDGAELTSADVLYSLRAPVQLEGLPFTMLVARSFDLEAATTPDESTVVLPATAPIADGRELICQSMLAIQNGTIEFAPDTPSSGPFTIAELWNRGSPRCWSATLILTGRLPHRRRSSWYPFRRHGSSQRPAPGAGRLRQRTDSGTGADP